MAAEGAVRWRSSASLDEVRDPPGMRIVVLAGNGEWLARQAVARAQEYGQRAATNLPPIPEPAGAVTRLASAPGLGVGVARAAGVLAAVAVLEPEALPVVVGAGAASHLAQPAIEWLQQRRRDRTFVDLAALAERGRDARLSSWTWTARASRRGTCWSWSTGPAQPAICRLG